MRSLLVRALCNLSSFIILVGTRLGAFSLRLSVPLLRSEDDLRRALGLLPYSVASRGSVAWGLYPRGSGRTTKIVVGTLWDYLRRGEKDTVFFCSPSKHRSERMLQQFKALAYKLKIPTERLESYGTGNRSRSELEQEITRGIRDALVVWDHEDP
jgi:hypothetical protein